MATRTDRGISFERRLPSQRLREEVGRDAENRPGIYRFKGPRDEVIYVGKSVRVRSRLLSYFRAGIPSKQSELLRVAAGIEWEYVANEFEALLREFRQIRSFRPRFNRRHRYERRFAWIRLTDEAAPRLVAARRPTARPGRYFGPFPAPSGLPSLLRSLAVSVGLRDCQRGTPLHFSDQIELFSGERTPGCLRADLGTCLGPCAGRCSTSAYAARVEETTRFLNGETDAPLDRILDRTAVAADEREYEFAAQLRDREAQLRRLRDEVVLFRDFLAGLSFVYLIPSVRPGADVAYVISGGVVLLSFPLPSRQESLDAAKARVRMALSRPRTPSDDLDAELREERFLVARWFRWKPEERQRGISFERFLSDSWPTR